MRLIDLAVRDFRNISEHDFGFAAATNVILGANGAGKTSLLEAVAVLGNLRSFRTSSLRRAVRHGERSFRLQGAVSSRGRDRRLELLAAQIKVTEHYLNNLRKRLGRLQREAADYKPYSDNPDAPDVPESLGLELSRTIASIGLYEQTLTRSRTEQDDLADAFAQDIERFRELKGS